MKISTAAILLSLYGASAYSVTRSSLRSLGQKTVKASSPSRSVDPQMKMEDFGFFTNSGIGFDDLWGGEECISEVGLENRLNKDGLRYKMNRTPEEEVDGLDFLPEVTLNLPIIGETRIGPPRVGSIWEALGFTATSNNEARQQEKLKAIAKARESKKGVLNGPGAEIRAKWLEKYGYPRLVGSGGIFYADQLSTDKEPMGGFNMGKSGSIWPVPDVVEEGQYGGNKGWGMKKAGPAIDGLPKAKL
ncbi:unnamed protein product [Cylindrotheca closterium]|uniref:Uncharacterized protein n=1 Tax=Cylindrotheca closterium TaxID=2856 RepID=A0AAD2G864_9STRA|nr:unnamed protein product [Cylindrotheca closterium]